MQVKFTFSGMIRGARQCLPAALGVFAYGIVFGVLARAAGLSLPEAVLMSMLVNSGAAQLVILGIWGMPLPVLTMLVTVLVVNARYLLMGAALGPWFSQISKRKAYGTLFFLGDETWALTMFALSKGENDAAFLLGGGSLTYLAWSSATLIGATVGGALLHPEQWGLDFAFTAIFLALLAGTWKGRSDLLAWAVAAVVAIAAAHWLPGKWYILLGGLAGSALGGQQRAQ